MHSYKTVTDALFLRAMLNDFPPQFFCRASSIHVWLSAWCDSVSLTSSGARRRSRLELLVFCFLPHTTSSFRGPGNGEHSGHGIWRSVFTEFFFLHVFFFFLQTRIYHGRKSVKHVALVKTNLRRDWEITITRHAVAFTNTAGMERIIPAVFQCWDRFNFTQRCQLEGTELSGVGVEGPALDHTQFNQSDAAG